MPTWSIPTSPSWPFALPFAPEPGAAGGAAEAAKTAVAAAAGDDRERGEHANARRLGRP